MIYRLLFFCVICFGLFKLTAQQKPLGAIDSISNFHLGIHPLNKLGNTQADKFLFPLNQKMEQEQFTWADKKGIRKIPETKSYNMPIYKPEINSTMFIDGVDYIEQFKMEIIKPY